MLKMEYLVNYNNTDHHYIKKKNHANVVDE